MKKTYIQPQIKAYCIITKTVMMAGSWNSTNGVEELHGTNGTGSSALGRNFDFDFDDDEE